MDSSNRAIAADFYDDMDGNNVETFHLDSGVYDLVSARTILIENRIKRVILATGASSFANVTFSCTLNGSLTFKGTSSSFSAEGVTVILGGVIFFSGVTPVTVEIATATTEGKIFAQNTLTITTDGYASTYGEIRAGVWGSLTPSTTLTGGGSGIVNGIVTTWT